MEKRTEMAIEIQSHDNVNHNTEFMTVTCMERQYYDAAMKGDVDVFTGAVSGQIESILTPNKNTILHVHLINYTEKVSETFVEKVLGMCPALLFKTNEKDETLLHIAARHGHDKIVTKLIDCARPNGGGAEKRLIRAVNEKKDTALHEAARFGHREVVEVLMKEEPDHTYFGKNDDDETPLYIAVERLYWDVVDAIFDNPNYTPQYHGPKGRNALHAAILHDGNNKEKVRKLLRRNPSAAKEADENGHVPLHLAAFFAGGDVVELLLESDRSMAYKRDNKGRIALHFAALHKDLSVMKRIIEDCPDCYEMVDENGFNALHFTTMRDRVKMKGFKHLLKDAPQLSLMLNEKDHDGNTALHLLARQDPRGSLHFNNPILQKGHKRVIVDAMACNKYGQTAVDVVPDKTLSSISKYKFIDKLKNSIRARPGRRVLDKQLKEKKHDEEKEKEEEKNKRRVYLEKPSEALSLVAILIATVAFTAGFTVPGGLDQDKGSPILKHNTAFIAFVIANSLSFILSTCVVTVISGLPMLKGWTRARSPREWLVKLCVYLTAASIGFMIIAFGTGLYAVLAVSSQGFGILTLFIVFSFFIIILGIIRKVVVLTSHNPFRTEHKDLQLFYTLCSVDN